MMCKKSDVPLQLSSEKFIFSGAPFQDSSRICAYTLAIIADGFIEDTYNYLR